MPIVVGALGTILKELVGKIQNTALSGTARLLRRVLELRLQDVTFTGNWLPVEYWEYIHNNNDIDKNNEKDDDDDDDDDDESGRQEKPAILISRLLLRMRRMSYVASIRLDLR